ncbi:hypothetical protein LTR85_002957 [Meristemomyces frigidus]|nr:hypothetical protein LTR85_002957 [Meristemomyces frigidus]
MSSEQTFSTSDLRSTAQSYKRDAAHKHKWALGSAETVSRAAGGKPRPLRPSETAYDVKRRETKGAVAALQSGVKVARKQDMLEDTAVSDDSGSASDYDDTPSPPADVGVTYSFDASRGPSQGSQILNAALHKAVKRFEERETVKLVKDEYEVLDDEGESVGLTPAKKGKTKTKAAPITVPDADDDYEFV